MYKLIADSGSTKTDWALVKDQEVVKQVKTIGLNPYLNTRDSITSALRNELLVNFSAGEVKDTLQIEFYGAGCSSDDQKQIIESCLHSYFPLAEIIVEHDLYGAARAVCGSNSGIAAILGTGSNSCYYDGERIVKNVISLGFILGDEGSGCYIGKQLVADFLNEEMPESLRKNLAEDLEVCKNQIFENVYKKPRPNKYLASFTKWIDRYYEESDYLHQLINNSFDDFFVKSILKYEEHKTHEINVVGSVGFTFKKELESVADKYDCKIGRILRSPIDGLVR